MNNTMTTEELEKSRADFEVYAAKNIGPWLERASDGTYLSGSAEKGWHLWQTAILAQVRASMPADEQTRDIRNAAGELIGIARSSCAPQSASMPVQAAPSIKPWKRRLPDIETQCGAWQIREAQEAEIAEWRAFGAALAAKAQQAAPTAAVVPSELPAFDPVVEANRKLLLERSHVGMKKYGTTLADAGLSRAQLAQHALEEALDLANYLQTIIQADAAMSAAPAVDTTDTTKEKA